MSFSGHDLFPTTPQESLDEFEIVDLLHSLAEKSLVHIDVGVPETRAFLLETVRDYARERLLQSPDAGQIRRRHLRYFISFAESADPEGPDAAVWLERFEREHENFRRALAFGLSDPDDLTGAIRLTGRLHWFWDTRGHLAEGRRWCELAIATSDEPTSERASALQGAGNLAHSQTDYGAAERHHSLALAIRRSLGDTRGVGRSLGSLAKAALNQGDEPRAEELFAESLAASRSAADTRAESATLINLGILLGGRGDHEGARTLFEDARKICLATGNQRTLVYADSCLASEALFAGDYADARERFVESLGACRALGDMINSAYSLEGLAAVLLKLGDPIQAATLYGAAAGLRDEIGSPIRPANRQSIQEDCLSIVGAIGNDAYKRAYDDGWRARKRILAEM